MRAVHHRLGPHKDSRSLLSVCQRIYILGRPDMLQFAEYSRILAHFATLFKLLIYAPAFNVGYAYQYPDEHGGGLSSY